MNRRVTQSENNAENTDINCLLNLSEPSQYIFAVNTADDSLINYIDHFSMDMLYLNNLSVPKNQVYFS